MLPREASVRYSEDLLPTLVKFPRRHTEHVWKDAEELYRAKLKMAEAVRKDKKGKKNKADDDGASASSSKSKKVKT